MDKELFKRIIVENQELIGDIELIRRDFTFENNGNYVFVGVRQCGKSYLLYQRMKELLCAGHKKTELVYVNFDDERISNIKSEELDLILQAQHSLTAEKPILFLDEIQNIDGWEHFARRLVNQKYQVYITGSNAKMLSRDIATTLGGRYLNIDVFPYSFSEYLRANNVSLMNNWQYGKQQYDVQRLFNSYFYFGGFPELILIKNKRAWLNGIFQKIFLNDIVVRNSVKNDTALKFTIRKLAQSVNQPTSYTRIANLVNAMQLKLSTQSVINYISYLSDSYLIFQIENFASKLVQKETIKKRYFIDNGLLNIFLLEDEALLLENLCAIHLHRLFGSDLYYYANGVEVDFYVPNEGLAVQSCCNLNDDSTVEREVRALVALAKRFDLSRLVIVTKDTDSIINTDNVSIEVIPAWKWLLQ
ncbi:MAG: ATP-binding protein [Muribaculaceae bacterium]